MKKKVLVVYRDKETHTRLEKGVGYWFSPPLEGIPDASTSCAAESLVPYLSAAKAAGYQLHLLAAFSLDREEEHTICPPHPEDRALLRRAWDTLQ